MDSYEMAKMLMYLSSSDDEMRDLGVNLCNNHSDIRKHFPGHIYRSDGWAAAEMAKARIRVLIKRHERKIRTS